jgi:hypothetical protein
VHVGVDVSGEGFHLVGLRRSDDALVVAVARLVPRAELPDLVALCSAADVVAIDAPDRTSSAVHADDPAYRDRYPHRRWGRCCDIASLEDRAPTVAWSTPTEVDPSSWMGAGIELWDALRAARPRPELREVYPHASFTVLNGARPPSKTTIAGLRARIGILRRCGVALPDTAGLWAHDGLDATVAALVAALPEDELRPLGDQHCPRWDGTVLWRPRLPDER